MLVEHSLCNQSVLGRGMVSFHLHNSYSQFTDHETETPIAWHLSTLTQLICFLHPHRYTQYLVLAAQLLGPRRNTQEGILQ